MNYAADISKDNSSENINVTALSRLTDLVKSLWFIGNQPLSLKEYEGYLKESGVKSCPNVLLAYKKLPARMEVQPIRIP